MVDVFDISEGDIVPGPGEPTAAKTRVPGNAENTSKLVKPTYGIGTPALGEDLRVASRAFRWRLLARGQLQSARCMARMVCRVTAAHKQICGFIPD